MKYLITVLVIICGATLMTLYFVWPEKPMDTALVAVTINGHDLAKTTVASGGAIAGYHCNGDYDELLDSVIIHELLIQEAQRLNLDKQESFRISLKAFYEESLIKTLMDHQYHLPKVEVSNEEIDEYLTLYAQKVTFTRLPVTPCSLDLSSEPGSQHEVMFDDLAEPMKYLISGLQPGENAMNFASADEQHAIRLDKVIPAFNMVAKKPERDQVRQILEECKRQKQIFDWLNELRDKALIRIHNG
jgi:hypothetical protein